MTNMIENIANIVKANGKIAFNATTDYKPVKCVFELDKWGYPHLDLSNGRGRIICSFGRQAIEEDIAQMICHENLVLMDEIPVPEIREKGWNVTVYDPEDKENYWTKFFVSEKEAKEYAEGRDSDIWVEKSRW